MHMFRLVRIERSIVCVAAFVLSCVAFGCGAQEPAEQSNAPAPATSTPNVADASVAEGSVAQTGASVTTKVEVAAGDWTQFRGPNCTGIASAAGLPSTWNATENIAWKKELPGPGGSSPIVFGDRVVVTSYSGYAEDIDNPGNMEDLKRHVICLNRETGDILWSKEFEAKMPESEYVGGNSTRHGYASSTPTTDGERIFVFFGASGVYALNLDGEQIWHTDVGSGTHSWGTGTSPVLFNDMVLVNAGVESESLYALNKATGDIVWQTQNVKGSWGSPVLADAGGRQEIVLNLPRQVTAFDTATGAETWHCIGVDDGYLCPTAVVHEGIVYAIGARKGGAVAVTAGGQGDVTNSNILWTADAGSNVCSPVFWEGHLYWTHESRGIVYCVDAATGQMVFEQKLDPEPGLIYASITAADGKFYIPSRENGTYVLAAKPQFELLSINVIEDDRSRTNASIAVAGGNQIYLRTDKAIYRIGQE